MSSNNWEIYKLGYLLGERGYIRGPFGSSLKRGEMKQTGIPVYEQQHAIYNAREFRYYIGEEKFKELIRFQVKTNDLIVSCSGTIGKISIIKEEDPKGIISQALLILRPEKSKVLPEYLKYYFSTSEGFNNLISSSHGSVQVNIASRNVVESISIRIPDIETQKRIVDCLSSFDKKIELNHQTNTTLEAIAQVIFKEWFVDFNFPGATGETVESELGKIPKGWRVGKLGDVCEFAYGKALKSDNRFSGDYPVVGSGGIVGSHNNYLVKGPGIVVGRKGTVGEITWINQDFFPIDTTFYIKDLLGSNSLYFHYFLLKMQNFTNISSDSAVPGLNRNLAYSTLVIIPPVDTLQRYNSLVDPFFREMYTFEKQSTFLSEIRDITLPKLMSGQIEI